MTDIAIPAADLLPVGREATLVYRLARAVLHPVVRCLFRLHISGRANIPRRNAIVIANHLQWLDCLVVEAAFPVEPRLHLMGDPSDAIRKGRLLWGALRRIGGFIPIDRSLHGNEVLFRQVHRCLEAGGSVMLFPEGRCGEDEGALLPFKKGFAHFAVQSGTPVVPVAITGTRSVWLCKRIDVVIGEPISPDGHTVESLVELTRARVVGLMHPYRPGRGPRLWERRLTRMF